MRQWKKVKLNEICKSISDGDHLPPPKADHGIPFITISNIDSTNHIDYDNTLFVPQEYYDKIDDKRKAQTGDILYSVVGSFGKPVLIKDNRPFAFQRHIAILRPDNEEVDSAFMYYTMMSYDFFMQADSVALGAAQRTISLSSLRNMTMLLPSLDEQKRISAVLSRYDSLIENYQWQIKLLEEAAQRLYKEWFVDLHFPGYENIKIVDGVPEGWEKKKLTDVLDIKYGKDHKPLKEGPIPVYGTGGIMRYVDRTIYSGESVLIPRKGSLNNIMLVNGNFWTIDTMFYSVPLVDNVAKIAYFRLKGIDMNSLNIGSAVPSMTINILSGIDLLLPSSETRKSFEDIASKPFDRINNLLHQLRLLTEARDRLLPKLMSGEIEV